MSKREVIIIYQQQFYNLLKYQNMSVITNSIPPTDSLKMDIKDFIQLLQRNQNISNNRRRHSLDSDKLSVIYSASEPQSSLVDKQNSHNSANKSRPGEQSQQIDGMFKEIKKLGLNTQQTKCIEKLENKVCELRKMYFLCQNKCKNIQIQYQQQKKGTDQILKALMKMDEAEKQLWANYEQVSNRYLLLQQKYLGLKEQKQSLVSQLSENQKDIDFMRKLVLVANQNYQNIQKKCRQLQRNSKMLQRFKQQRSSPQITSRSTIVQKKSSCSPTISDRSNMSARKGSFEENYRKLVLRTLKSKAIH